MPLTETGDFRHWGWRQPVATTSPPPPATMDRGCGKAQPQRSAVPLHLNPNEDARHPLLSVCSVSLWLNRCFVFHLWPGARSKRVQPSQTLRGRRSAQTMPVGVATACRQCIPRRPSRVGSPRRSRDQRRRNPRRAPAQTDAVVNRKSYIVNMQSNPVQVSPTQSNVWSRIARPIARPTFGFGQPATQLSCLVRVSPA